MPSDVTPQEIEEARALVQRHFGFSELRAGQAETLARVRRGEDVLAILPTGGGKSLCYQLPGVLSKGVTLIVSPLIALMKDQLDSLPPAMRAAATSITSELTGAQQRRLLDELAAGRYRLLYVAPERLRHPALLAALLRCGVSRLVVDEAHCVSTWGHDFRPDYLGIAEARRALADPPLLALTATAPPRVEADIKARLGPLTTVRASVYRPNLRLEAIQARDADEKMAHLLRLCAETKGPGVVYASSRAKCEQLAAALRRAGVAAEPYHAGLPDRALRQDAFMNGDIDVLVATVAFGMGVDKSDLRFIVHHDPSTSLENYYQEAGRAGRDGKPARCVVIAARQDVTTMRQRARSDLPSQALVGAVWKLALEGMHEDRVSVLFPNELDAIAPGDEHKPRVALNILEEAGALERLPGEEGGLAFRVLGDTTRIEGVMAAHAERASARGEEMFAYVRETGCRHAHVGRFFGEQPPPRCGNCDNCLGLVHEPMQAPQEDEEAAARAVLEALGSVRGLGEVNLVYLLRADARAADWLTGKPAWGALAHRSESKVKALIRSLEAAGLVARETLEHGGAALKLAPMGARALVHADAPLALTPARAPARAATSLPSLKAEGPAPKAPPPDMAPGDAPLFEALRAWRREASDVEGVPPYVIAHDAVLREIAATRPRTLDALRSVEGMGPKKVERYGAEILRIVTETDA